MSDTPHTETGLEAIFERTLWSSRFLVVIPVVASIILAIIMFFITTVDVVRVLTIAVHYADPALSEATRTALRNTSVAEVAGIVDGYLFAAILLIFAFGLYELFVGKINIAEKSEIASRVLLIQTLDDLKERLATLVFLILVIRYFEFALQLPVTGPLDLLYIAVGVALIAVALYLTKHYFRPTSRS